jgi:hypothetical protein
VCLLCDVCLPHVTAEQQRRLCKAILCGLESFVRAAAEGAAGGELPTGAVQALESVSRAVGLQHMPHGRLLFGCGLAASMLKASQISSIAGAVRVSDICRWLGGMLPTQRVLGSEHKSACVMLLGRCVSLLEGNGPLLQQQVAVLRQVMPAQPGAGSQSVQELIDASFESCASWAICNNPSCSNLSAASERVLVTGKQKKCGRCRAARYCSAACQEAHWQRHKHWCRQHAVL